MDFTGLAVSRRKESHRTCPCPNSAWGRGQQGGSRSSRGWSVQNRGVCDISGRAAQVTAPAVQVGPNCHRHCSQCHDGLVGLSGFVWWVGHVPPPNPAVGKGSQPSCSALSPLVLKRKGWSILQCLRCRDPWACNFGSFHPWSWYFIHQGGPQSDLRARQESDLHAVGTGWSRSGVWRCCDRDSWVH